MSPVPGSRCGGRRADYPILVLFAGRRRTSRRCEIFRNLGLLGLVAMGVLAGCDSGDEPVRTVAPAAVQPSTRSATFVGADVCGECHAREAQRWRGSHHDRAMQIADVETVLGDFAEARFTHYQSTSRFFRRDDGFFVETEGADGKLAEFEVAYTFGLEPLQQYLVRLPGGRLQPLNTAWDSRPLEQGGQRWFHLYPDEPIPHDDMLHWTGRVQNWNQMCAACHSTGLHKGYDLAADVYDTTWQELDVACEACHGPGSSHMAWARLGAAPGDDGLAVDLVADSRSQWHFVPGEPIAQRSGPPAGGVELATCARCHSRRTPLRESSARGKPFLDSYRPALLDEALYFADGQIQDEVYVWGSFVQSPMFAAGVTCSDCHDPHSLAVAEPPEAICAGCHRAEVYATPEHHQHAAGSAGASCLGCHMPARTYMGVDPRRDHSLRVPRPDLAEKLGTPDACTMCHTDRDAAWAAQAALQWWGDERRRTPHYGELLHAGRRREPGAGEGLVQLVADSREPAIVRATALRLLQGFAPTVAAPALERALRDADALLRMAAAETAELQEPGARLDLLRGALRDPVRAVRIEAARALVGVPAAQWDASSRRAFEAALGEYRAVQRLDADTPAAHVNLGLLHVRNDALEQARMEYETALRLAPWFVPAYVNLADVERRQGDDAAAEATLRRAIERAPANAAAHFALGLTLVRQHRADEALATLARAAGLDPAQSHYSYVYAVALHSGGRTTEALGVLARARARHPGDPEILLGQSLFSRDVGETQAALAHARALVELAPDDPAAAQLLRELEARAGRED